MCYNKRNNTNKSIQYDCLVRLIVLFVDNRIRGDVFMENKLFCCCFLGHRKITETDALKKILYDAIEDLIVNRKVNTFLFGSKSEFDDLCYKVVDKLKESYSHIKRVYVRAEFPYIDDNYRKYLLESYEDTYYPSQIVNAGRSVYIERNYEMINNSNFCVVYYDENYKPPRRKYSRKPLTDYQPQSGTRLAYDYAAKSNVEIINVLNVMSRGDANGK